MEMTLERLKAFGGIQKEVDEIQRELDSLYFPITSPNGRTGEGYNSTPGDPTASAFNQIQRQEEKLARYQSTLAAELEAIEEWLQGLPDHELCAIIRAHYLLGDTWERCTRRILSYENSDTAKMRVYRYFGRIK